MRLHRCVVQALAASSAHFFFGHIGSLPMLLCIKARDLLASVVIVQAVISTE
jgi:hypothetical protein